MASACTFAINGGNWPVYAIQNVWGKFHKLRVRNKWRHHAVSMAITNFVWTESDRAVHEELNDTKFLLFDDV